MNIADYQIFTKSTAVYPEVGTLQGLHYSIPALTEEAGEVAGKWAKYVRKGYPEDKLPELKEAIIAEAGDVFWQLCRVLDDMNIDVNTVLVKNKDKLVDRMNRNVIIGEGDER